ncbi:MAG: aldolase [Dehalococcoidales bacterium]|nr:aldolase [Dehalococcoidales bacterium]
MILAQFQSVGRDLCAQGLISHAGNLSIRLGDRLIITRRDSNLSRLEENDLVETGIDKNDRCTPLASIELPVHRAIYHETSAKAVVHAHPPHAVALSLIETELVPPCGEGSPQLERVPVLGWNMEVKPGGLSDIIARVLKESHIVMARGHGSFAIGQLLQEALNYTTMLEECCKVSCLLKSINASVPGK